MTTVWNLDHALGGGLAALCVLAVVGLPIAFMLFTIGACRDAGRPRPTPAPPPRKDHTMSDIKIRVAPSNAAAYVSEEPDSRNLHHGVWKHSDEPVAVLWTGGVWIEHPQDVDDCPDCRPVAKL
jgi:hypothetical protein